MTPERRETHRVKIALTIAGSDSGGGAGIQADLKTFHQFGVFGTSALVALTAQNTLGVSAVEPVSHAMVTAQLDALAGGSAARRAQDRDARRGRAGGTRGGRDRARGWGPLVVDPVMVSTSGDRLLSREAERVLRDELVPLAALVTPNLDEAEILTGTRCATCRRWSAPAPSSWRLGAGAALIKGGHLDTDVLTDVLVWPGGVRRFRRPRLRTTSTHGTGCTLARRSPPGWRSAAASRRAVADALDYVARAIAAAPALGQGHGPLDHDVPGSPPALEGLHVNQRAVHFRHGLGIADFTIPLNTWASYSAICGSACTCRST